MFTNHAIQCFRDVFNTHGKPRQNLHLKSLKFNIQKSDSNPLWIGFESQFQKVKKIEIGEGDSNPFIEDSNPFEKRNARSALREKRAFLSMFRTFFGFIYFYKNNDKVQNLLRQLVLDHFELIYYIKNGSKEAIRILFLESCRKPNVKGFKSPK